MIRVTEADLLAALETASDAPEDARTVLEIREATGIGEKRLRRAMTALRDEGRLMLHKVVRRALDGKAIMVPAYTIAPKKAKK